MIVQASLIAGTLALMSAAALRANGTLPTGELSLGGRQTADTSRWFVLLEMPLVYIAAIVVLAAINAIEGETLWDPSVLLVFSVLMLIGQQGQYWSVRRMLRKQQR